MQDRTDNLDLGRLRLTSGEGRRFELEIALEALRFGGETYEIEPSVVPAALDISCMTRGGYALRLRFAASLTGPCMRCLEPAQPAIAVDSREVDQPGGGEDLASPYVNGDTLDLAGWARDAFALAAPDQVLCRPGCAGLCPICAANLNQEEGGPTEHQHERAPDPRWAKLGELELDS
ncbi:MAG: YceD family protein [Solirubrobacteraceae bacterium]